jgi:hypothetical protein
VLLVLSYILLLELDSDLVIYLIDKVLFTSILKLLFKVYNLLI